MLYGARRDIFGNKSLAEENQQIIYSLKRLLNESKIFFIDIIENNQQIQLTSKTFH